MAEVTVILWHKLSFGTSWPGDKVSASGPESPKFESQFRCSLTVYVVLVHVKYFVVGQTSSLVCSAEVCREELSTQVKCSHLIAVQNCEVDPKISPVLLQNQKLI
ncbi:hypothetical protein AVEN_254082-1 [Araneus ventricosus]|uniref:Uncharacterized protein n=1 Tax=Araneus ventricosus TaxID=182803 RepID=A0A4Y2BYZ3_ARAVE|nr:hypothetical protein AVEN_254082-1 [Araneus ventricosus]